VANYRVIDQKTTRFRRHQGSTAYLVQYKYESRVERSSLAIQTVSKEAVNRTVVIVDMHGEKSV
jgi:hypothetical protein